jgi:hypothetical protein
VLKILQNNENILYFENVQLIISIAIKPYLKKYLANDFDVEPLVVGKTNQYTLFLFNSLRSPEYLNLSRTYKALDPQVYSDTLKCMVCEDYWNRHGSVISEEHQFLFNKFVQYNFCEEFYRFTRMRIGKKGSLNEALREFLNFYDLCEDDLPFKTIQKMYERRNARLSA